MWKASSYQAAAGPLGRLDRPHSIPQDDRLSDGCSPFFGKFAAVHQSSECACGDGRVLPVRPLRELVLNALHLVEARLYEVLGEDVGWPALGSGDLVVEGGHGVIAVEEACDQHAGGGKEPAELCEDAAEVRRRHVDGRVPGKDACH